MHLQRGSCESDFNFKSGRFNNSWMGWLLTEKPSEILMRKISRDSRKEAQQLHRNLERRAHRSREKINHADSSFMGERATIYPKSRTLRATFDASISNVYPKSTDRSANQPPKSADQLVEQLHQIFKRDRFYERTLLVREINSNRNSCLM